MLITKDVEIEVGYNPKYYEEKGYKIPRGKNKYGKITVPKGVKIIVNVNDLSENSHIEIKYMCDYCLDEGKETIVPTSWRSYHRHKNDVINKDACKKHSTQKTIELGHRNDKEKLILPKEEIVKYYLELANKIQGVPKHRHIKEECKINSHFPTIRTIQNVFGELTKLKEYCKLETQYFKYSKEELLNILKIFINNNGILRNRRKDFTSKNGLPAYKTYTFHFGDDLVNIIELCGYILDDDEKYQLNKRGKPLNTTKEQATKLIYNMQNKLDRPLMYDDFRNPQKNEIGITLIKKY
jgi:hypothetical protein